MTYDLHGSWEAITVSLLIIGVFTELDLKNHTIKGHNAPLYPRANEIGDQKNLNVDSAVKYWIEKGAPASKLVLGLATYGRTFTLSTVQTDLGAPASGAGNAGSV